MLEDVQSVEVHAHMLVLASERRGAVETEIEEIEPTAHVHEITNANLRSRVARLLPFLDRSGVVDLE